MVGPSMVFEEQILEPRDSTTWRLGDVASLTEYACNHYKPNNDQVILTVSLTTMPYDPYWDYEA